MGEPRPLVETACRRDAPPGRGRTTENRPSMSLRSLWNGALDRRHGGVVIFIALFLAVAAATRVAPLVKAADATTFNPALAGAFAWGLVFDLGDRKSTRLNSSH